MNLFFEFGKIYIHAFVDVFCAFKLFYAYMLYLLSGKESIK